MATTYRRKKASKNKYRTVKGYTRKDGVRVKPYTRKKDPSRTYRTVTRKK